MVIEIGTVVVDFNLDFIFDSAFAFRLYFNLPFEVDFFFALVADSGFCF